jgi:hypothetical protein
VNIRSINAKKRLQSFINQLANKYDIISVSESWLGEKDPDAKYKIDGYTGPFRLDRTLQGAGGVMVWVIDTIIAKRRDDISVPALECIWLQLEIPGHKILFGTCYRQPDIEGHYGKQFWEKLQASYDKASQAAIQNIVITGDFNADLQTDKNAHDKLNEFLGLNNLTQHIDEPTRITIRRSSILDLIITNYPSLVINTQVSAPVHYNDHCTISGEIAFLISKRLPHKRKMWNFKDADFDGFRSKLDETTWENCFITDDINEICETWTDTFLNIAKSFVQSKLVTVRPKDKSWYNNYLRRLARAKDRSHHQLAYNRTDENLASYHIERNFYFDECDRIRLEFEEQRTETLAIKARETPKNGGA